MSSAESVIAPSQRTNISPRIDYQLTPTITLQGRYSWVHQDLSNQGIGGINLAAGVPYHASMMFARNITAFLTYLIKDQKLNLNVEDEIVRETLLTRGGQIVNQRVREFFKLPALTQ